MFECPNTCIYNLYVLHHTICVFLLIIYCTCASVSFLFEDQWKRHVCYVPVGGAGQWVIRSDWGSAGLPSTVLGDPEGAWWQNTEQVSSTTHAANQLETLITNQSSFCVFPCILLYSLQLIRLHWKICCEYRIAMFFANMHWVYAHIFCSRRISTASNRPKKEFKPKSIVSSLETVENTQHNGLTHTSSVKSTGIDEKTSQRVCFSLSMKSEHMHNLKCCFLDLNITFSCCNFSRSWNKLLLSRIT